ncbi:hypothetical protein AB0E01_42375 [Nocardia vinacea]|uniref:hypothetical protein n=1 Tax=Nocardia vinacea TaxID=96468 RepID=UPI0033E93402
MTEPYEPERLLAQHETLLHPEPMPRVPPFGGGIAGRQADAARPAPSARSTRIRLARSRSILNTFATTFEGQITLTGNKRTAPERASPQG